MGSRVDEQIRGYGSQEKPFLLPSETGYDLEACLRESSTTHWPRLQMIRLPGRVGNSMRDYFVGCLEPQGCQAEPESEL